MCEAKTKHIALELKLYSRVQIPGRMNLQQKTGQFIKLLIDL